LACVARDDDLDGRGLQNGAVSLCTSTVRIAMSRISPISVMSRPMPVKVEDMMRELFSPKERAAIRRAATAIAKRHLAKKAA
jgi:hypothetical protein